MAVTENVHAIGPQKGKQTDFLSSPADIAIYGGAAGSGKTFALLLENTRHTNNPKFGSVIFRRESTQITSEGGLWDTAVSLYAPFGIKTKESPIHQIKFQSGSKITMTHLQLERTVYAWQGSQIPLICFEELTHFTQKQFFYMLSRNRSTCGVKPYIRCTTNPDAESWVANFIAWWINQDTGYPIPERSGKIRWFTRINDQLVWGDTAEEISEKYPAVKIQEVKSVTFISASIYDNQILLESDPDYLANLKAQSLVEQERLLHGNWKIKAAAGLYFKRSQVEVIPAMPEGELISWVRKWDLAATEPSEATPNPDATASVLMGKRPNGRTIIAHVTNDCLNASAVRKLVKNTAETDKAVYKRVKIIVPQDPAQAGKEQAQSYIKMLAGFNASAERETGSKVTRAEPFASQWQAGNVDVVAGDWNEMFFDQLEAFPSTAKDDMVDAASGAFNALHQRSSLNINPNILKKRRW